MHLQTVAWMVTPAHGGPSLHLDPTLASQTAAARHGTVLGLTPVTPELIALVAEALAAREALATMRAITALPKP